MTHLPPKDCTHPWYIPLTLCVVVYLKWNSCHPPPSPKNLISRGLYGLTSPEIIPLTLRNERGLSRKLINSFPKGVTNSCLIRCDELMFMDNMKTLFSLPLPLLKTTKSTRFTSSVFVTQFNGKNRDGREFGWLRFGSREGPKLRI